MREELKGGVCGELAGVGLEAGGYQGVARGARS